MKTQINQLDIPLECYKNGELDIYTLGNAAEQLAKSNHSIVAPLDLCVWNIGGHRGQNHIYTIAGEKPALLGLLIYTNHGQPFTIDEAESLINKKHELKYNTFLTWASKYNRIFKEPYVTKDLPKELRPFYYLKVANGNSTIMRPAYQMCPGRTSFVVLGVDLDRVDNGIAVHWPLLISKLKPH